MVVMMVAMAVVMMAVMAVMMAVMAVVMAVTVVVVIAVIAVERLHILIIPMQNQCPDPPLPPVPLPHSLYHCRCHCRFSGCHVRPPPAKARGE